MSIGVASLMVVEIVDVERVVVLEAEDDAPDGAHRHGPEAGEVSLERVKPEAREVHVVWAAGRVEPGEDVAHGVAVLGSDPPFLAAFHEPPARRHLRFYAPSAVNDAFVLGHRLRTIGAQFVSRWLVPSGGTTGGTNSTFSQKLPQKLNVMKVYWRSLGTLMCRFQMFQFVQFHFV